MDAEGTLILGLLLLGSIVVLAALAITGLVLVSRRGQQPGRLYAKGRAAYQQRDYAAALELFRTASERGYARAQLALGNMYLRGRGVARDPQQAARLIGLAAEQGLASAQYRLGQMYRRGNAVPQSLAQAERWLRAAADQGYAAAITEIVEAEGHLAGDQPTWIADRQSLADQPTQIVEGDSLANQPTQMVGRQSLAGDQPTWIADRPSLADRPTMIDHRQRREDSPPAGALDLPTAVLSAPQAGGPMAIWCPQCASPMLVHSTQQGVTFGRLYRCPACGFSCDEGDPRTSLPPGDPARCRTCGAANDWDRAGGSSGQRPKELVCRKCGQAQG